MMTSMSSVADAALEPGRAAAAATLELSVVMPCLNEARTLGACIRKAQRAIAERGLAAEIIVADNGSTDGSQQLARELGARVVDVPERGYGAALMSGIRAAHGDYIVMADADDSYDFGELGRFVDRLREGNELVMGCRLPSGGGTIMPGAMPWKHRWLGNPVLSALGRMMFRSGVRDFHCGMRGFRRDAIVALDLRTTGMEFASEMVIKATLRGARIAELPITLHKDGRDRPPHLRSWRDGWRHLRFMLLFSPRWLFLAPGVALLLAGMIFGAALVAGPLFVGHVGFDTSTLLMASMSVIVGFQLIVYATFTRAFAVSEGLLKPDKLTPRLMRVVTLEVGIVAGLVCTAIGLALIVHAVLMWRQHGFGALNYSVSQRWIIPGVTGVILGIQIIFSSFFISVLGLARR